tara:strand:+ start:278 stop:451 length:174 start_codon:yes stop_codon:yes gene_type:complete
MEFIIYGTLVVLATFVIVAINEIAKEVRNIKDVFESHYQLERVPVRENSYKRKGVEL